MTKRGIQAFAGGIILATAVLASVFYLTDEDQAVAVKEQKTVTEQDVNNYLDSKKMVSVNRDEYQKLLDSKEKSLSDDSSSDSKNKVKTYKLIIKDGMSTADVSAILEKEGIISSAKDFNDYVIDAGYHKEIRAGEFKVKSDMSFKKIVKTLTR
ncbi:endolytic transglycosylase MltG [Bacillus halotolerans]|uniref:endolytic transglycosylase MltG n=1 Tax=Bacillus halotolerans TaxID=260554 RepID=UPI0018F1D89B|nr:endolytic transglycosylase MltG [Bacillus halotolerans]MBJ7570991.1 endolytic transglycosylase MltG [Bacillus halotolerans]